MRTTHTRTGRGAKNKKINAVLALIGRVNIPITHIQLGPLHRSRLFFFFPPVFKQPAQFIISKMRTTQPLRGFHSSLPHQVLTVLCYVPSHQHTPRLIRATPTRFVNSHNKSRRLCSALRHQTEGGQSMAPYLNLHE